MIGALATVTKRLRFTNNAFVLPIRNPFLVAKALSTLAVLSDNRLTLTLGVGWSKDEFGLMGQDFHTRGRRTDEMIEVMRKLWSGDMVSHEGRYYSFPRLEMSPAPSEPIPIWVGGISAAALSRAARLGDGWLSDWQSSEEILSSIASVRRQRLELGRSADFDVMATPNDAFDVEGYQRLEAGGVTHLLFQPYAHDAPLEEKQESLREFGEEVIGKF